MPLEPQGRVYSCCAFFCGRGWDLSLWGRGGTSAHWSVLGLLMAIPMDTRQRPPLGSLISTHGSINGGWGDFLHVLSP